jgi:hypothetical protein
VEAATEEADSGVAAETGVEDWAEAEEMGSGVGVVTEAAGWEVGWPQ